MTKKSKVYTKTGDQGETSLLGGTRVPKSSKKINLYGEVDHLNSLVGSLICSMAEKKINISEKQLYSIQNKLFSIGSYLACEDESREKFKIESVNSELVKEMEEEIDILEENLPELKNFILPGGAMPASFAHLCRTQTRKVERLLIEESYNNGEHGEIVTYINRLSDYFFVLSRKINDSLHAPEVIWKS